MGPRLASPFKKRVFAAAALLLPWVSPGAMLTAEAQSEDASVIVVEVWSDTDQLDANAVRLAIGTELGVIAVSPWDPRAPSSRGTIRVRIDGSNLEVEYEERHSIRRRVPAPANTRATEKTAAFLAGNLARHEASDIATWLGTKWPVNTGAAEPAADVPAPQPAPAPPSEPAPRRLWFGLSGEMNVMPMSGTYYSVTGNGEPFPYPTIVTAPSGLGVNGRFLFEGDYAVSEHTLLGGRVGAMFERYPGKLGSGINFGRFHLEARATFVAGAIANEFAPYACTGLGVANYDAEQDGGYGAEQWKSHGPVFLTGGIGAQVPLSTLTVAMIAPAKFTLVFPTDPTLVWSPEVTIRVGF